MKLSNVLNSALVFSAKKDVRYYLNGINIYFKADKIRAVCSTDGHTAQLLSVFVSEENNIKGYESMIISNEDAKRLAAIYSTDQVDDVSVTEMLAHASPVNGNFPDITRIIPGKDASYDELIIGIDYKYLARVSSSLTKLSKGIGNKYPHAKFTFKGDDKAIRIDANVNDSKALIIIMPCRMQLYNHHQPA